MRQLRRIEHESGRRRVENHNREETHHWAEAERRGQLTANDEMVKTIEEILSGGPTVRELRREE